MSATTSALEVKRVDSVPTPRLGWYACYGYAECATLKVPRDYDRPAGAGVELAVLRVKARDQKHRVGSLFVNPGGPGGSGTQMAYFAPYFLGSDLLDRFDIVGLDPRGTNFSDQVTCFKSPPQQARVMADFSVAFPYTDAEEKTFVRGAKNLGRACSTTGKPLSAAVSTAEVARDLDVLRRAVGDKKLTYLGFSYGTYLGQVYANMFPDRFRALAIDGVLDPIAWAGTNATKDRPQTDRIRSADGATKALIEILKRCDRVGGMGCQFAPGDPVANLRLIAERLKAHPFTSVDPGTGTVSVFGYADLVSLTLALLYYSDGSDFIISMLSDLIVLTEPPASAKVAATNPAARSQQVARRAAAQRSFITHRAAAQRKMESLTFGKTPATRGFGFPYDNSVDAFASVLCTDSVNPASAASWPAAADAADKRAPYFGRAWIWSSAWCARNTWTAKDEDAYRGPFNKRTAAPVLIVGNLWDPATNYAGAVKAASLLPNSRLLSSDSWGHTAYGSSQCVTSAVESYLLAGALPAAGTRCVGDIQPFASQDNVSQQQQTLERVLQPMLPVPAGVAHR